MSDSPKLDHPRYQIIEKLGEGGMSIVYKAFDRISNQTVVLKQSLQKAYSDHLLHEFEILSRLNHPGIPSAYDFYLEDPAFLSIESSNASPRPSLR